MPLDESYGHAAIAGANMFILGVKHMADLALIVH